MATTRIPRTTRNTLKQLNQNKMLLADSKGKRAPELTGKEIEEPRKKRAAFGDITNASKANKNAIAKKIGKKVVQKGGKKITKEVIAVPRPSTKVSSSQDGNKDAELSWDMIELSQGSQVSSTQGSTQSSQKSGSSDDLSFVSSQNAKNRIAEVEDADETKAIEPDWEDVDKDQLYDVAHCGIYAPIIFNYYKQREATFALPDYLPTQKEISAGMRAILVDWLVEVQENFELNHETLYLAVKLVDLYLSKKTVSKDSLQLVGATALFISCKFDERCPPLLDDFLYICDDAYQRREMIRMELDILKTIGFDLGIPLSYRFLRRYAKCARADMQMLTLGRFILEMSLMEYKFTQKRDSLVAASALLLAFQMKGVGEWNGTMIHYTGYTQEELLDTLAELNAHISAPPSKNLTTIRAKYSHRVFHEVAKIPTLSSEKIQQLRLPTTTL